MEEQSNEALWYVVHTYSGYETKVATAYRPWWKTAACRI